MDKLRDINHLQRSAAFQEWSPSIHYAQFQRVPTSIFPKRRLYDFELLYVVQGQAVTIMHEQHFNIGASSSSYPQAYIIRMRLFHSRMPVLLVFISISFMNLIT